MSVYDNGTMDDGSRSFFNERGIRLLKNNTEENTGYIFYREHIEKYCIIACLDFTRMKSCMDTSRKAGDINTLTRFKFPTLFIISNNASLEDHLRGLKEKLEFENYLILSNESFLNLFHHTRGFAEEIYAYEEELKSIPSEEGRLNYRLEKYEWTRERIYALNIPVIYDSRGSNDN
jgi:hypothetical protein